MLRSVLKLVEGDLISIGVSVNHLNPVFYQCVRWKRKPRWLPTAKSKMFRVPERKKLPIEEAEELKRLYNNYRTEMKSIRNFFAVQLKEEIGESGQILSISGNKEEEEEELKRCFELNEQWNANIRKLKEEILAKEKEAELEEILKIVEENKLKVAQRKREIEEVVRLEKERAKFYITAENVDEAIDKALDNPIDYNFAIDLKGNYYYGRKTKPSSSPSEEKQSSATAVVV